MKTIVVELNNAMLSRFKKCGEKNKNKNIPLDSSGLGIRREALGMRLEHVRSHQREEIFASCIWLLNVWIRKEKPVHL